MKEDKYRIDQYGIEKIIWEDIRNTNILVCADNTLTIRRIREWERLLKLREMWKRSDLFVGVKNEFMDKGLERLCGKLNNNMLNKIPQSFMIPKT